MELGGGILPSYSTVLVSVQVSYENRIEELQRELRLLSEEKEKVSLAFLFPSL